MRANRRGWRSGSRPLHLDDFYLTHDEQLVLARRHPGNRFLQHRGHPGTHDVALGVSVLTALRTLRAGSSPRVPGYDRSAFGGTGDRLPESDWREVVGPLDLVVLEGWMLGFMPVNDRIRPIPTSGREAKLLRSYTAWHALLSPDYARRRVQMAGPGRVLTVKCACAHPDERARLCGA